MPREVTNASPEPELLKRQAWTLWAASTDTADRVRAVEMVIEAHWHRSREGCEMTHPGLATFAAHWLGHGGYAWYSPTTAPQDRHSWMLSDLLSFLTVIMETLSTDVRDRQIHRLDRYHVAQLAIQAAEAYGRLLHVHELEVELDRTRQQLAALQRHE